MGRGQLILLILGSAGVGALISSVINGLFSYGIKRQELERQDMQMALDLSKFKHEQMIATHETYQKSGRDASVTFFDPHAIDYHRGIKEYRRRALGRRTGRQQGTDRHDRRRLRPAVRPLDEGVTDAQRPDEDEKASTA